MLSRDELDAWLRLATTPGIGRAVARRLLAALGSAERVLAADDATLRTLVDARVVQALRRPDPARLDTTLRWLDATAGDAPHDIVVLGDPRFPDLLLHTADPPLLLFTRGRVELLAAPAVAIVGSRSATPQGMDNARAFAHFLSEHQLTIVSGLAMGIDGAAHEGGLAGPGSTVAFVGTGLDRVYPPRHAALTRRIAEQGLVASEYPLGMDALPINFPRRNRLIAGIARGTLVVEAALESGSLITAHMALEAGREVFAIPGSIHSPQSRGCHRLIQEGAKLVETGDDVLHELRFGSDEPKRRAALAPRQPSLFATAAVDLGGDEPPDAPDSARRAADPDDALRAADPDDALRAAADDDALRAALGHDPVTFDVLAARTGLPSDQLAARLLELELAGVVQRLPGGLLQRRALA
jgi:DNA processing protein